MLRALSGLALCAVLSTASLAQTADAHPAFEAADVHISPARKFPFKDGGTLHGDRYIVHQATMLDLISAAYGLDNENVQGGPSWLEQDRYDVIAKASATTSKDNLKLMLQALLAERFNLVVHTGSKPMPAYALIVAKDKPKMTESDGTATADCQYQPPPPNQPSGTISLIVFSCHNTTMETFAEDLHNWAGGYLSNPVFDATGLKGSWDFDIKWTNKGQLQRAGADGISIFDAVEKELGLKLDLKTAPRPVLIVDSVNEKPTANAAGLEKILPPAPPAVFDVATIKPAQPDARMSGNINGGQVNVQGFSLKLLISYAWDLNPNDNDSLVAPKWLDTDRFDILAKVSGDTLGANTQHAPQIDQEDLRQMLRALLIERFQIKSHIEDRPLTAYTLVAVNPTLKKADPLSRTRCTEGPGPDGKDPRIANPQLNRLLTCQNMTMAQIGDELQRVAAGYIYDPVLDGTGIKGSWDFTLSFSSADKMQAATAAPPADGASDPSGAVSVFDAVNKQLGLKLEKVKRPEPVVVIDHMEETPTDN